MHGRRIERQCRSVNFVALGCPTLFAFANRVGLVPCHGVQSARSNPKASSAKCSKTNRVSGLDPRESTDREIGPVTECDRSSSAARPRGCGEAFLKGPADRQPGYGCVRWIPQGGALSPSGSRCHGRHLIGKTTREQRFGCYARGSVTRLPTVRVALLLPPCCSHVSSVLPAHC